MVAALLLALIVTPIALVAIPGYIGWRLWYDSPGRAENIARQETEALYQHALAGRVELSEAEIDKALQAHWPTDMPAALAIQLLQLGCDLYDAEGLNPEVPPIPALCNTLEGGRYRDRLALLGQVRHDRGMALDALDTISRSLTSRQRIGWGDIPFFNIQTRA